MLTLQKPGGWAAFGAAITFIIGFAVYTTLLIPAGYGSLKIDAAKHAAFLVEHRSLLRACARRTQRCSARRQRLDRFFKWKMRGQTVIDMPR